MARKQRMFPITITKDSEWAFELLKAHRINISELCREAIVRRAEILKSADSYTKSIDKKYHEIAILEELQKKRNEEEKILKESIGEYSEREKEVMEKAGRWFDTYGWLSRVNVMRMCQVKEVDHEKVWLKLPHEWTATDKGFSYEEMEEEKPYEGGWEVY